MRMSGSTGLLSEPSPSRALSRIRRHEGHTFREHSTAFAAPAHSVCMSRQLTWDLHARATAMAFGAGSLAGALLGGLLLLLR